MAQYESPGRPLKYSEKKTMLRGFSRFFIDINADTTKIPQNTAYRNLYTGVTCAVDVSMEDGESYVEGDLKVWRVGLKSENAKGISLFFDRFLLPEGGKLFVYNKEQTKIFGAFTSKNNNQSNQLLIRPLPSDSIIVEYQEPLNTSYRADLHISLATHELRYTNDFLSSNICSPHATWQDEANVLKQSVCLLFMVGTTNSFFGSGSLINNPQKRPYVYTAGHNITSADMAKRTIFYFNYEVPAQDSTFQGSQEFTISGSTLLARADDIDFALVELNKMPPITYRPYLAGWTREYPTAPMMCIQHPNGDIKKVSFSNSTPSIKRFNIYNDSWNIARWDKGVTESGSSGSPLFDANGYIVGQLTGGSSFCNNPVDDYFSRLLISWDYYSNLDSQLACHLDPDREDLMKMEGCDPYVDEAVTRISNITKEDEISLLRVEKSPLVGHNAYGYNRFAERFDLNRELYVHGAYIVPFKGRYNANVPINLNVYSGGDTPETLLSSVVVNPQEAICTRSGNHSKRDLEKFSQREIFVALPEPVLVSKNLFVSLEISYDGMTSKDTLALACAMGKPNCTAYFYDGQWKLFTQHPSGEHSMSIWVDPVVSKKKVVGIDEYVAQMNNYIVYPNPTKGQVNITPANSGKYKLYNLSGNLISEGYVPQSLVLPEYGFYLLELTHTSGQKEIHKLICH